MKASSFRTDSIRLFFSVEFIFLPNLSETSDLKLDILDCNSFNLVSNAFAHVEGSHNISSGYNSHAEGYYTIAKGKD